MALLTDLISSHEQRQQAAHAAAVNPPPVSHSRSNSRPKSKTPRRRVDALASTRYQMPPRFTTTPSGGPTLPADDATRVITPQEFRTFTPPPLGSVRGSTEYSLFGSSSTKEESPSSGREGSDPSPDSDRELLAKAPGYRGKVGGTSGGVRMGPVFPVDGAGVDWKWPPQPRARRYSDSSSSGLSSEDSGVGSISGRPIVPGLPGWGILNHDLVPPSGNNSLSDFLLANVTCGASLYEETMRPYRDRGVLLPVEDNVRRPSFDHVLARCQVTEEPVDDMVQAYCTPDEPMTLPRIESDLNPNAPDFIYPSGVRYVQPTPTSHYASPFVRCPAGSGGHQRPIGAERRQQQRDVGASPGCLDPELEQFLEDVLAGRTVTGLGDDIEDEPPSIMPPLY